MMKHDCVDVLLLDGGEGRNVKVGYFRSQFRG